MPELIAIATYKRPELLSHCVESVLAEISRDDRVLVVDNDSAGSARSTVEMFDDERVIYAVETTAGIAAARNCALEYFFGQTRFDAISFVDDDETVGSGWNRAHRDGAELNGADATFGPVLPVYHGDAPRWIVNLDFFARARTKEGADVKWPATNNARITGSSLWANPDLRFSDAYSMTGGSDTDFFFRLRQGGAKFAFLNSAVVSEVVAAERSNVRWLWRRGVRLGNVSARMLARQEWRPARIVTVAIARVLLALPLAVVAYVRRSPAGPQLMNVPKGVGMIRAVGGRLTQEYARSQ